MHSIRLRHPWEEIAAAENRPALRRRFNKPTGLDASTRVTLEIDRITHAGNISLNGTPLGEFEPNGFFAAEITSLLQPANELQVELDSASAIQTPPVRTLFTLSNPTPRSAAPSATYGW